MHSISFFFFVLLFLLFLFLFMFCLFLFLFLERKYQPRMKKKKKKNEIMFRNMIKVDSNNDNNTIRNFSMFYFIQGSDRSLTRMSSSFH